MAQRGINKVILIGEYMAGDSTTDISNRHGLPISSVRDILRDSGVIRSRTDAIRLAAEQGKLGSGLRGKKRTFTDKHIAAIKSAAIRRGEVHASGVSLKKSGYIEVTRGANKGKGAHRVVAENYIGRSLKKNEVVHHIDGNRANNDIENLAVMSRAEHSKLHATENNESRARLTNGRYQ